ncbi:hypothetical protein GH714_010081 [Hevea brasiliensis]|uniref:ATP-dependent RNA helicase n=1 Tax=Hevea brasiliensis TaxID=3981 RepID=A0A6A6MM62_HEVBR|nr:hypothetical protein GH714_010081 [Hevea brasiliensis]
MTPKDHIKALADRFMKEGAEDLWNENDGPLKPPLENSIEKPRPIGPNQQPGSINSPIDLRKLISEARNVSQDCENFSKSYNYTKTRDYSAQRSSYNRGFSSPKLRRFRRNGSSSSDDEDEDYGFDSYNEGERRGRSAGEIGGRAALRKYDVKTTKRVPLKELEKESDFAKEVELIRHELGKKSWLKMKARIVRQVRRNPFSVRKGKFDECGLSPLTVKALTAAGYVQMTRVQEATLSVCLDGKDALVKAKTGQAKLQLFWYFTTPRYSYELVWSYIYSCSVVKDKQLPAIEAVLKAKSGNANPRVSSVYILIICPTRELASQIAAEANAMLKYHDGIGVQTLVGGTRFKDDQKRLESDPCQIIVATPGRLLDHIENKGGLSVHLMGLKMLILDEADYLLDLGFRKDVEKIVDCLPRQRQSLLFSATIPKEVRRISQLVLKREHAFIDTLGLGCLETPAKVRQSFLVVPHELHFQVVHYFLKEHIRRTPDYKVIVFCTTGMVTSLMYMLLREMKMNVREMHSRKPQLYRARVSDEFKESKRSILVTSDVSARGMNYPDVTLVIQAGIPADREQYIHRLGRTGREGKDGEGILLLAPWEEYFLNELEDLPLDKLPLPNVDRETKLKVEDSMSKIDSSVKEAAYHAWLGYYNSIREIGRDKTTLVELANRFSESIGLQRPPHLFRKTALKMGLKDIPGIRIRA